MRTELGKIQKAEVGNGGYQDAMFGVSFVLGGESWGVGDFWGAWGPSIKVTESTKWTEADRLGELGNTMLRLANVMKEAKVKHVSQLEGIPVECSFDGQQLSSWRVLKEVL